jgi:hypothetical protein
LFIQDGDGPLCRGFFVDVEEAKLQARRLAEKEGYQYFIFDLFRYVEVARISPLNAADAAITIPINLF